MKHISYICLLFVIVFGSLLADEIEIIPRPLDAERYRASWDVNPFAAKVDRSPPTTPSWSQNWALAGMFNNNGSIRVTIKNISTGQMKYVSSQSAPCDEFKLIKAQFNRNRENASVVISRMNEEAALKYQP